MENSSRKVAFRAWNGERMLKYENWFTLHRQGILCFEDKKDHSYVDESDVDYPSRVQLMQFTGLRDKNGVEIYEGDIMKVLDRDWVDMEKDTKTLIVYFDKGEFLLTSQAGITERESENPNQYNKDWIEAKIWRGHGRDRFEVIGNIYQNPELTDKAS